jgi:hypothetical protein
MKVGDYVVAQTTYRPEVRKVIRVSDAGYYFRDGFFSRDRWGREDQILFAGEEADARLLCQRLISSQAQYDEERSKAVTRRQRRDDGLIRSARNKPDQSSKNS